MSPVTLHLANDTFEPLDGITHDARLIGTAQANSTVTILEGGTVLADVATDRFGNFTYTPSLGDGSHTLTAQQQIGQSVEASQLTFKLDTVAPSLTFFRMNDGNNSDLPIDNQTGHILINAKALEGDIFINAVTSGVETGGSLAIRGSVSFTSGDFDIDRSTFVVTPIVRPFTDNPVGDGNMTSVIRAGSAVNTLFRQYVPDGTYTVHINVSDLAGNSAVEMTRPIIVDLRADAGETANLRLDATEPKTVTKLESQAVSFIVSGLDTDASALAYFTDGLHTKAVAITSNGNYTVDLTDFSGLVSTNLSITDIHSNTVQVGGETLNALVSTGGAADDVIVGSFSGADHLAGGIGNDSYFVHSSTTSITENVNEGYDVAYSDADGYQIGSNVEALVLYGNAIVGTGNESNNTLIGNSENNILNGMSGADTMLGGKGNDIYIVDSASNVVMEYDNEGYDTVYSSVTHILSPNIEQLILTGNANIDALGNELDNRLVGNDGNNTLYGGAGADIMMGGKGNDIYVVDSASDIVIELANHGYDTVYSSVTHILSSDVEQLILTGNLNINALGNELDNRLVGNDGNNTLYGGGGADTMLGGKGNDIYVVDSVSDIVIESTNEGYDTVYTSVDYVAADNVEQIISTAPTSTTSTLIGNNLNNRLMGHAAGNDYLYGGAGNDTFVFLNKGSGYDTIVDFHSLSSGMSEHDVIEINHELFSNYSDLMAHAYSHGTDTIISYDSDTSITLTNTQMSALQTADFVFV